MEVTITTENFESYKNGELPLEVGDLPFYASGSVFFGGDSHFGAVFRQQVFYQFRPLQETEVAAVEIIFVAHVVYLIEFLDAVEIEVVDR